MKELNEDISKKDERIGGLESQLRMVQVWADDFAGSLKTTRLGVDQSTGDNDREGMSLQKQLTRLQSKIENGFRVLEANAYEMKVKAEEAELAKNKALEFTATTLANSSVVTGQHQHQQQRPRAGSNRTRGNHNNTHIDNQPFTQHNNHSDLNMMLNDSLVELDHQISLTESSSPSVGSSTPDLHDQHHHHHHRRARSPSVPHQHQHQHQQPVRRLSRSKQLTPNGSSSSLLTPQQQEANDEQLALGNAQEEIRRLNMMVDELERLIHLKINV
jgi:hypothetical protein